MKQLFALLVLPPEPEILIRRLEEVGVKSLIAFSCADAFRVLERDAPMDFVFTGMKLPGGAWYDVFRAVIHKRPSPRLAVCLPQVDGGWVDLLEWGASAVLAPNYDCGALRRLVAAAPGAGDSGERQLPVSANGAPLMAAFNRGPSANSGMKLPVALRKPSQSAEASQGFAASVETLNSERAEVSTVGSRPRVAWHARGGATPKPFARDKESGRLAL